jgi:hypothetical protein
MFLRPSSAPTALKLTQEAAPRLGIRLQVAQVGAAEELLPELTMIAKERPDALFMYPTSFLALILGLGSSSTSPSRPTCPRCMRSVFS